jgi:uncharacterized C2H2 Zn-finger protein
MKLFKQQEAQTIVAHGKALTCPHCGHEFLDQKSITQQLHQRLLWF